MSRDSKLSILALLAAFLLEPRFLGAEGASQSSPEEVTVQPTRYFVDVERYRFGAPDVANPDFYPIPREKVTRDTYLRSLERLDPDNIALNPNHGMNGPRAFMPVLVKFVETGEARWGAA